MNGAVRLGSAIDMQGSGEGGEGVREGRVEVCVNRAWGTVCNELFTQNDADVVCNQLEGFKQEGTKLISLRSGILVPRPPSRDTITARRLLCPQVPQVS